MSENNRNQFRGLIIGECRSGTTLSSSILNRHPEVYVTPETNFFHYIALYQGSLQGFIKDYPGSLRVLMARIPLSYGWTPDPEPIIQEIPSIKSSKDIGKIFLLIGRNLCLQHRKYLWLEKTPYHLNQIPLIEKTVKVPYFIHIVRDGRAVVESLNRMPWASDGYIENAVRWLFALEKYRQYLSGRGNVYTLQYENLIINTKQELRNVCDFLKISYSEKMLVPDGSEKYLIEKNTSHKTKILGKIDSSNLNNWREIIPDIHQKLLDRLLGYELKKWGYETEFQLHESDPDVCVAPYSPSNKTHPEVDAVLKALFAADPKAWLRSTESLGKKVRKMPRYWVQFEDVLPQRLITEGSRAVYSYIARTLLNIYRIRKEKVRLIYYFTPDSESTEWKMKAKIKRSLLDAAYKVVVNENKQSIQNLTERYGPEYRKKMIVMQQLNAQNLL